MAYGILKFFDRVIFIEYNLCYISTRGIRIIQYSVVLILILVSIE